MVNCRIESMYLCVNDMDRAVSFYEQFFEQRVTKKKMKYIVFLILMVSVLVYLLIKK